MGEPLPADTLPQGQGPPLHLSHIIRQHRRILRVGDRSIWEVGDSSQSLFVYFECHVQVLDHQAWGRNVGAPEAISANNTSKPPAPKHGVGRTPRWAVLEECLAPIDHAVWIGQQQLTEGSTPPRLPHVPRRPNRKSTRLNFSHMS